MAVRRRRNKCKSNTPVDPTVPPVISPDPSPPPVEPPPPPVPPPPPPPPPPPEPDPEIPPVPDPEPEPIPTPVGDVIDTLSLLNWSTQPTWTFKRCGMIFRKGVVPAGTRLRMRRQSDGVYIRAQFDKRNRWGDGSLRRCVAHVADSDLAGSAERFYELVAEVGAWDNTTTKTVADVMAGHNFNIRFTNVTRYDGVTSVQHGSGEFRSYMNEVLGVSTRRTIVHSGAVSLGFKAWGQAKDNSGGAEELNLTVEWYPNIWMNSDGSIADIEFGAVPSQYWWAGSGEKFRLDYTPALYDGDTLLETYPASQHIYRSQFLACYQGNDHNHGMRRWASRMPTITYRQNKVSWVKSKVFALYDTTYIPPAPTATLVYKPFSNSVFRTFIDQTGGYNGRGYTSNQDAYAFMGQRPLEIRNMRVAALTLLHLPCHHRSRRVRVRPGEVADIANTVIPVKMLPKAASYFDFTLDGLPVSVDASNHTTTTNPIYRDGYIMPKGGEAPWKQSFNSSHSPSMGFYAALYEGEEYMIQAQIDAAVKTVLTLPADQYGQRKQPPYYANDARRIAFNIQPMQFSGLSDTFGSNTRKVGWAFRDMAYGILLCSEDDPQCNYLRRLSEHSADYISLAPANMPQAQKDIGSYDDDGGTEQGWQEDFIGSGLLYYYRIHEYTPIQAMAYMMIKSPLHRIRTHIHRVTMYHLMATWFDRSWEPGTNEFETLMPYDTIGISLTNGVFTLGNGPELQLRNGDKFRLYAGNTPPGLTQGVVYYAVQVSTNILMAGATFKLSATVSGAPIPFDAAANTAGITCSLLPAAADEVTVGDPTGSDNYANIAQMFLIMAADEGDAESLSLLSKMATFTQNMWTNLNGIAWKWKLPPA